MLRLRYLVCQSLLLTSASLIGACDDPAGAITASESDGLAPAVAWAGNPELGQAIATLRAATALYHDESLARAAGYRPSSAGCESSEPGAMGIHYGHPALLGLIPGSRPTNGRDAVIDPLRPEVLMYEPQADGTRRLVGVEFVVYRSAWDAVNTSPPTFFGVPFDQLFGPHAHGHADHYELHLWLWRNNPLGMFSPWNPKVSC